MDEPISHLEAQLRAQMRVELKRLHIEVEATTVYVTHDQIEAMALADRIAVMNLGELQQVGTPSELFDRPVNQFVAGFIGTPPMNFLSCELASAGDKMFAQGSGFQILLPDATRTRLLKAKTSGKMQLGIRPLDLTIAKEESPADARGGQDLRLRAAGRKLPGHRPARRADAEQSRPTAISSPNRARRSGSASTPTSCICSMWRPA